MSVKGFTNDPLPVAIYNADEKKLIAIFKSGFAAHPFLFGKAKSFIHRTMCVGPYVRQKTILHPKSSVHPFRIAIRYATPEQKKTLGEQDSLILIPTTS